MGASLPGEEDNSTAWPGGIVPLPESAAQMCASALGRELEALGHSVLRAVVCIEGGNVTRRGDKSLLRTLGDVGQCDRGDGAVQTRHGVLMGLTGMRRGRPRAQNRAAENACDPIVLASWKKSAHARG
jgi:hypothetical protein